MIIISTIIITIVPSNVFMSIGSSNLVVWAEPDLSPSIQDADANAFCCEKKRKKKVINSRKIILACLFVSTGGGGGGVIYY